MSAQLARATTNTLPPSQVPLSLWQPPRFGGIHLYAVLDDVRHELSVLGAHQAVA